jgi:hypothetical protein
MRRHTLTNPVFKRNFGVAIICAIRSIETSRLLDLWSGDRFPPFWLKTYRFSDGNQALNGSQMPSFGEVWYSLHSARVIVPALPPFADQTIPISVLGAFLGYHIQIIMIFIEACLV